MLFAGRVNQTNYDRKSAGRLNKERRKKKQKQKHKKKAERKEVNTYTFNILKSLWPGPYFRRLVPS